MLLEFFNKENRIISFRWCGRDDDEPRRLSLVERHSLKVREGGRLL